jgi:hypothetical protein
VNQIDQFRVCASYTFLAAMAARGSRLVVRLTYNRMVRGALLGAKGDCDLDHYQLIIRSSAVPRRLAKLLAAFVAVGTAGLALAAEEAQTAPDM